MCSLPPPPPSPRTASPPASIVIEQKNRWQKKNHKKNKVEEFFLFVLHLLPSSLSPCASAIALAGLQGKHFNDAITITLAAEQRRAQWSGGRQRTTWHINGMRIQWEKKFCLCVRSQLFFFLLYILFAALSLGWKSAGPLGISNCG